MTAVTLGQARISHRFLWLEEDCQRQRLAGIEGEDSRFVESQRMRIREAMAALAACRQDLEKRFPELVPGKKRSAS